MFGIDGKVFSMARLPNGIWRNHGPLAEGDLTWSVSLARWSIQYVSHGHLFYIIVQTQIAELSNGNQGVGCMARTLAKHANTCKARLCNNLFPKALSYPGLRCNTCSHPERLSVESF